MFILGYLRELTTNLFSRKRDIDEPQNHDSISLTPALSTVFESLVLQQFEKRVKKNKLVSKSQFLQWVFSFVE